MTQIGSLKRFGSALILATAAALLLTACGRSHSMHDRRSMDPAQVEEGVKSHVDRMLSKLDVTDDQRAKAYALRDRVMPDILALVKAHQEDGKQLKELWSQPTFDTAKLNAQVDKTSDEMKVFLHKMADVTGEFHALLTPEQRDKLQKMCERWGR